MIQLFPGFNNGIIRAFAGNGTKGYSGDGGSAVAATLFRPQGVTVNTVTGTVLIADTYNNVIRSVAKWSGVITTAAGTGFVGYNGDGICATSAELKLVRGVATDPAGAVWLADSGNNRIRQLDPAPVACTATPTRTVTPSRTP